MLQTASNGTSEHRMMCKTSLESVVVWFVIWLRDPSLSCAQFICHHGQWCNEGDPISPICLSFPPASSNDRSVYRVA
ncbi:hypothetical protein TNCV_1867771 [Trichonephila clavipes]|nr:hypothetical protein TNCV_1867771 [Trichonephila clavipes]